MSEKYDEYLKEHKENVFKAFCWLEKNLPEIFNNDEDFINKCKFLCEEAHDQSKFNRDQYEAYDAYFYGGNQSYKVVQKFNEAWLTHIHKSAHHWQHWVLLSDNPDEGEIILDMPDQYIIEMICDWWSFSFAKGNLNEIFMWYNERAGYMKLSEKTRKKVEYILDQIRFKLVEISKSDADETNNIG